MASPYFWANQQDRRSDTTSASSTSKLSGFFSSCRLQSTKGTRTGRNATSNFGGTTLPSSSCKAFGHGDVTNVGNQNIGKLSIDYQSNCWFSNWKRGCAMIMLPSNKSMLLIAFWGGSSTNIIRSCSCHNTSGRIWRNAVHMTPNLLLCCCSTWNMPRSCVLRKDTMKANPISRDWYE